MRNLEQLKSIERTQWWNAKKIRIWIFAIAVIPDAAARASAANACNIILKANSFPVAVSRMMLKRPMTAALEHLQRRGICNTLQAIVTTKIRESGTMLDFLLSIVQADKDRVFRRF